jgi:hypothetical protein
MSEKAITIGMYAVASGIFTLFSPNPRVAGGALVRKYLEEDVERGTGGKFLFTRDMDDGARRIVAHLDIKRKSLNLSPMMYEHGMRSGYGGSPRNMSVYEPPTGLTALGCGKVQDRSQAKPPEA